MIKKMLLLITIVTFGFLFVGVGVASAADNPSLFSGSKDAACGGATSTDNPVQCTSSSADTVNNVIKIGLNILSIIVGVAAVVMIMVGGFKFVTSQGESANIANARNTILYAVIGLAVAALAQIIVRFVLTKTTPPPPAPPAPTTMLNEVKSLDVTQPYVV